MCADLHINLHFSVKIWLFASAKSIDSGQPEQSAQADLNRNFLPLVKFEYQNTVPPTDLFESGMSTGKACMAFRSRRSYSTNQVSAHASSGMMYLFPGSTISLSEFVTHSI